MEAQIERAVTFTMLCPFRDGGLALDTRGRVWIGTWEIPGGLRWSLSERPVEYADEVR